MRTLGCCISALLASALRNLDSSQYHDFKRALKCVSALVDFSLTAQYRGHTPETLVYMERYLQTFDRTKDIRLEFRTSKCTRAAANGQDRDLRELMANQRADEAATTLPPSALGRWLKRGSRQPISGRICYGARMTSTLSR